MLRALPLSLALMLLAAVPAAADELTVTAGGDAASPPPCLLVQPTTWQCTTLRGAVAQAAQTTGTDEIVLPALTVALTAGPVTLSTGILLSGQGARATVVQAAPGARLFEVPGNSGAGFNALTLSGGDAGGGDGGLVRAGPGSSLSIVYSRLTGGRAARGAAISTAGELGLATSLVHGNAAAATAGGAVHLTGPGSLTRMVGLVTTIAGNAGGGLRVEGTPDDLVQLVSMTIARNAGPAVWAEAAPTTQAVASILEGGCGGVPLDLGTHNVDAGTDCGLGAEATSRTGVDPGLASALTNEGGGTDVLTIAPWSPAVDLVRPCPYQVDQRALPRVTASGQACDAGAYELSADPSNGPAPTPTPTGTPVPTAAPLPGAPVTPVATAAPTPAPVATPVAGRSVAAEPVRGTVLVRAAGAARFVPLAEAVLANGAEVDARRGEVRITRSDGGAATFRGGQFTLSQPGGITTVTLTEKLACGRSARSAAAKPRTRRLWGDGRGRFRTRGEYSSATVRGTRWLVQDTCATTLTRVTQGTVIVLDEVRGRTVVLRAGKRYVARARG
jgi:hypothetical protein